MFHQNNEVMDFRVIFYRIIGSVQDFQRCDGEIFTPNGLYDIAIFSNIKYSTSN